MKKLLLTLLSLLGLAAPLSAQSCVFKVTSGERTLYLGGTFHLLRSTDMPPPPEFDQAFAATSTVYFETDIGQMSSTEGQALFAARMQYPEGQTLKQVLSPEAWQAAKTYARENQIPLNATTRLTPFGFAMVAMMTEFKNVGLTGEGVDQFYLKLAKIAGRKVGWYESLEEQITMLAGEPGRESQEILAGLESLKPFRKGLPGWVTAWRCGDLTAIDRMYDSMRTKYPEWHRRLLTARNGRWLVEIEKQLKTPEVEFILVGAAHLAGPEGLVAQLKDRGCTVEQIVAVPKETAAAPAPRPERKLHIQHIGSRDTQAERGLGASTKPPAVQRLLLDLATDSQTIASVDAALAGSGVARADLENLGLIRCAGGRCWLNFGLITAADGRTIRDLSQHYATSLADALLARRAEFEKLFAAYDGPGVDPKAVGFIALGCVALDWDGLDLTAEKGLRRTALPKPDGNYVPQAMESSDLSAKRVYCGSRHENFGGFRFATFGDNDAPRRAFPDFLWHRPTDLKADPLPSLLRPPARMDRNAVGRQLRGILLALRERECSPDELAKAASLSSDDAEAWIRLLTELEYLVPGDAGLYRLRVPVFAQRDRPMLLAVRQLGGEILSAWLDKNNGALRRDLAKLAVLKQGVPFEEVFNYVWHDVFGLTNDRLVQAGLFADPHAGSRTHPGSIACAFGQGVLKK